MTAWIKGYVLGRFKAWIARFTNVNSFAAILLSLLLVYSGLNYLTHGIFQSVFNVSIDFGAYYAAATVLREGGDIYDRTATQTLAARRTDIKEVTTYIYPPFWALVMVPFSLLPYAYAKILWLLFNQMFLFASIYLMLAALDVKGLAWVVALFLTLNYNPVFLVLNLGQVDVFLLFLIALAFWLFRRGQKVWVGVLIALAVAIKITPALVGIYFMIKREYRVFVSMLVGLLVVVLVSTLFIGFHSHVVFIQKILPSLLKSSAEINPNNQSISAFFARLLVGEEGRIVPWFRSEVLATTLTTCMSFLVLLITFVILFLHRSDAAVDLELSLVLVTMLLVSRITWEAHLVWLLFPIMALLLRPFSYVEVIGACVAYAVVGLAYGYGDVRFGHGPFLLILSSKLYGVILLYGVLIYTLSWGGNGRLAGASHQ